MYIAVAVAIIVVGVFLYFGFFGIGTEQEPPVQNDAQVLLDEIARTGSVAALTAIDTVEGTGDAAALGDTVTVHYIGVLTDGTVFDASEPRGEPFTFSIGTGGVIQGWEQGIPGMKVGGTRILAIPAELAYGERAVGSIPANSPLIFQVQLLKVEKAQ